MAGQHRLKLWRAIQQVPPILVPFGGIYAISFHFITHWTEDKHEVLFIEISGYSNCQWLFLMSDSYKHIDYSDSFHKCQKHLLLILIFENTFFLLLLLLLLPLQIRHLTVALIFWTCTIDRQQSPFTGTSPNWPCDSFLYVYMLHQLYWAMWSIGHQPIIMPISD